MPSIVSWPKHIQANTVINSPNISYDWLPTFADAAGETAPERIDGVSLMPSLLGKGRQGKSLIYIEYYEGGRTPDFQRFAPAHRDRQRNQMQMIRLGDTVAVRYNIHSQNDNFEIYNVIKDPQEINNLADSLTQVSSLEEELKAKVLQVRRADTSAPRPYDSELIPSVKAVGLVKGVKKESYQSNSVWIPDVSNLKPFAAEYVGFPNVKFAKKHSLEVFTGCLKIPVDGEYTFYLSADNKAFFRLHQASIIDEDYGYKGGSFKTAKVLLKAGLHPFHIYCLAKKGVKSHFLKLEWKTPFANRQTISPSFFYR